MLSGGSGLEASELRGEESTLEEGEERSESSEAAAMVNEGAGRYSNAKEPA